MLAPRFGDGVDVLVGVGRESFLPRGASGERNDGRDLIAEMRARGYHYARTPEEFLAAQPNIYGKALALFAAGPYEPEAAVEKAIALLSRNPRGYFLMVEWDRPGLAGCTSCSSLTSGRSRCAIRGRTVC